MSRKGRITEWQDDRGFGFITPLTGGRRMFVHISSFTNKRSRRPRVNDLVTYTVATDLEGRPKASQAKLASDTALSAPSYRHRVSAIVVAAAFFALLGITVVLDVFSADVWVFYASMSIVAFVMYWYDKSASRSDRWRTRESTLHAVALLGGWPGAFVAMQIFRHKSSKQKFRAIFWATVVANFVALFWLGTSSGASILRTVLGET